jgi:hypothetical protein
MVQFLLMGSIGWRNVDDTHTYLEHVVLLPHGEDGGELGLPGSG